MVGFAVVVGLSFMVLKANGVIVDDKPPPGTMPCPYDPRNGEPSFTPCTGNDGQVVR